MRTELALVAATLLACGGDDPTRRVTSDAGRDEEDASKPRDAGKPDAGRDSGTEPNELGGQGGAGTGGSTGGVMAVGGSGGSLNPPEGGAGAGGQGGEPAPQERVLWSHEVTVSEHEPLGYGAMEGDQMGLRIETDKYGCTIGDEAQPSGETREYRMDGKCLTTFDGPLQVAVLFYRANGESAGLVKRNQVTDWDAAVSGKTVLYLKRTQTWNIDRLCDAELNCWNLADFQGRWEAIGY